MSYYYIIFVETFIFNVFFIIWRWIYSSWTLIESDLLVIEMKVPSKSTLTSPIKLKPPREK